MGDPRWNWRRRYQSGSSIQDRFNQLFNGLNNMYHYVDTVITTHNIDDETLQDIFDQSQPKGTFPKINVIDCGESYLVEAALAGFRKDNIRLSFKDNALYIKLHFDENDNNMGKRNPNSMMNKNHKFLKHEISFRNSQRGIKFPERVDVDKINSSFEEGMLTITLGKKKTEEKSKSININID